MFANVSAYFANKLATKKAESPVRHPCNQQTESRLRPLPAQAQNERERTLFLSRREAAAICGISVQTFDTYVRKGILPGPLPGTRRWSRAARSFTYGTKPWREDKGGALFLGSL